MDQQLSRDERTRNTYRSLSMWSPAYDIDLTTLPDPTVPVAWEDFEHLECHPDLLQRVAFWAYYAAHNAELHSDKEIATFARMDAQHVLTLAHSMNEDKRISIRRETLAAEYVPIEQYNILRSTALAFLCLAIGLALALIVSVWQPLSWP